MSTNASLQNAALAGLTFIRDNPGASRNAVVDAMADWTAWANVSAILQTLVAVHLIEQQSEGRRIAHVLAPDAAEWVSAELDEFAEVIAEREAWEARREADEAAWRARAEHSAQEAAERRRKAAEARAARRAEKATQEAAEHAPLPASLPSIAVAIHETGADL